MDYPGIEYLEGDVDDQFVLVDECNIESDGSPTPEVRNDKDIVSSKNKDGVNRTMESQRPPRNSADSHVSQSSLICSILSIVSCRC